MSTCYTLDVVELILTDSYDLSIVPQRGNIESEAQGGEQYDLRDTRLSYISQPGTLKVASSSVEDGRGVSQNSTITDGGALMGVARTAQI